MKLPYHSEKGSSSVLQTAVMMQILPHSHYDQEQASCFHDAMCATRCKLQHFRIVAFYAGSI